MTEILQQFKQHLKDSRNPGVKFCITSYKRILMADLPLPRWFCRTLLVLHLSCTATLQTLLRIFYWTPLFKSRLRSQPRQLYLYSGMPLILGTLDFHLGDNCRISGVTTFCGRPSSQYRARLEIANNVDVSWQTTIAVGTLIIIENNVRIAANGFLAGYPGHPLDPVARAQGLTDTEAQIGKIHLKEDVWLGTNVTVLAGVTIGRGSVIATGSVVTKDIPAGVLAGGIPARVLRQLDVAAATSLGDQNES